jgi:hypothetical protein
MARCFDSDAGAPDPGLGRAPNAVNCGSVVCGAGEQCCLRQPREPYCAPASATCSCEPPQQEAGGDGQAGSTSDASGDASATEAGGDAAGD